MRKILIFSIAMFLLSLSLPLNMRGQAPGLKDQLKDFEVGDHWIYNDFQAAVDKAKKEGKALFVLFR